jgi:hypothetical protein
MNKTKRRAGQIDRREIQNYSNAKEIGQSIYGIHGNYFIVTNML